MTNGYDQYQSAPDADLLKRIESTTEQLTRVEQEIEQEENKLKELKKQKQNLAEKQIPDLMEEAGFEEFKTTSGHKVQVKDYIRASIPKQNAHEAFKWLEEHGHGNVIKRGYDIQFNREQEEQAEQFQQLIDENFPQFAVKPKKKVEPQTLQALIRECLEEGEEIPMQLFGAIKQRIAKVR